MSPSGPAPARLNVHRGGSGEPLVLLHGIGSSLRAWQPLLSRLEREHDVLALDLPGFGESPPLQTGQQSSVPALADAVERELDALELGTVHFAGNSLGGWTALELARRGRARTVVALSPAGMPSGWEVPYNRAFLRLHRVGARLLEPYVDGLMRRKLLRTLLCAGMMGRPWRVRPDEAAYAQRVLARAPAFDETLEWTLSHHPEGLHELRVPVLLVWGRRDRLLFPWQGRRYVEAITGAELRIVPALGHVPMSDDPELVARTILELTGGRSREPAGVGTAGRAPSGA